MSRAPIPVIFNPIAGGGRLLRHRAAVEAAAAARGSRIEWWGTAAPGDGERLGRRAVAEHRPLVLAFGGDGTYNEVGRALLGTRTALGVVPGGTTSVLAYELGVPRPAGRAVTALLDGEDRPMRVGRTSAGDCFLIMLSAGPDALVLDRMAPRLKRQGKLGITATALRTLLSARLPRVIVTLRDQRLEGGWAIVGKCRCYGGPYHATPGADPFGNQLELVLQRSSGRAAALPFFLGIPGGRHLRRRDVVRCSAASLRIEAAEGERVAYQVDGDAVGYLPVEVWVDSEALMVRLPVGPIPATIPAPVPA